MQNREYKLHKITVYRLHRNSSTENTDDGVQTRSKKYTEKRRCTNYRKLEVQITQKLYKVHRTGCTKIQNTKVQVTLTPKVQVHIKRSTEIHKTGSTRYTEVGIQSLQNRMYKLYRTGSTKEKFGETYQYGI